MNVRILAILIACLFFSISYSKEDYKKGWIVNARGDTIHGLINFKDWRLNPKEMSFKINESTSVEKHTPKTIKAFGVDNNFFESFNVSINQCPRNVEKLEESPTPHMEEQTVFLHLLFKGTANLYSFMGRGEEVHFFIKKKDQEIPEELVYHMYLSKKAVISPNQKKDYKVIREIYKGQLKNFFKDCGLLYQSNKFERLPYTSKEMIKLFQCYHECQSENTPTFSKKSEPLRFKGGIALGMTNKTFQPTKGAEYLSEIESGLSPMGSLFLDVIFPWVNHRYSFYNEVQITSASAQEEFQEKIFKNTKTHKIDLDYQYLGILSALRYHFLDKGWIPYLEGGFFFRGTLKNDLTITNSISSIEMTSPADEDFSDISRKENGLVIGGGIKKGDWGLNIRYLSVKGGDDGTFYAPGKSSLAFALFYTF